MRKAAPFLLIGAFFALLLPRISQSIAQGDVYPEWSTMRSDPLGAKVLYLALQRSGRAQVERNYEALDEVRPKRAQYVLLGVSPLMFQNPKPLERLLTEEGVVLLALRPASGKVGLRTERFGFIQVPRAGLQLRSDEWKCLDGERTSCWFAEKALGKGKVRAMADGSVLRNGELHHERDTATIARAFAGGLPVVFDESHLGVNETGGVGVLLSRYRLFPAVGLMLFAAMLFVWRNSVSLLPEREPVSAAMTPQPAASLRTLLAQRIPSGKLLEALATEWRRALPLLPAWHRGRSEEMESALERAKTMKDPREGYAELQAAIRLRKGSA